MGKQIQFVFGKKKWKGGLTKVDREKVYGYVEEVVSDKNGDPCTLLSMLDDGKTLVPAGATALKTIDIKNREIDKSTLKTVYMDGSDAVLVPSSYGPDINLKAVDLDAVYNLEVTAVYQVDFETIEDKTAALECLSKVAGLSFVFNYRDDYEGADAIIVASQEKVFILTGRALSFDFLTNQQAVLPAETEEESEEEVDFGML